MESTNPIKGIVFIIKNEKGEYLLQLRDNLCTKYPNQWNFPGGSSIGNETPEEALVREAHEEYEISLLPDACEKVGVHKDVTDEGESAVFLCSLPEGQHPVLHEGADMKWFSIDVIRGMDLGFSHKKLVELLDANAEAVSKK
jgi:8-oxo-dGTP pyrophosphatase MutT (NUDIX family)